MTDKELLELAAKAADVKYDAEASKPHPKSGAFWGLWLVIDGEPSEYQRRYWNPLKSGDDALALAAKFRMNVNIETESVDIYVDGKLTREWLQKNADVINSTRRAITRAAAEIGKAAP